MTAKYFAILTNYGAAQLANAVALGTQMNISAMAVGDGGGTLPVPDPAQTKLVRENRRAAVNQVSVDEKNPNFIIAEQVIPENEGGWWIREIGLFDDTGGLIAVGNAPETYKPNLQEGSGRTQVIQMVLMVSSTQAITLKVDPSVVLATREYVTKSVDAAIQASEAKAAKIYATKTELSSGLSGKQPTGDYATRTELNHGLSGKQPTGDYATKTEVNSKLAKDQNGADIPNKDTFIKNLGLGGAAKSNVVQATGDSITDVMSQRTVTFHLSNKATKDDLLTKMDIGYLGWGGKGEAYSPAYVDYVNDLKNADTPTKVMRNDGVTSNAHFKYGTVAYFKSRETFMAVTAAYDGVGVRVLAGNPNTLSIYNLADTKNVIGIGQTWQNMTASRTIGTTYTNATTKPIMISVTKLGRSATTLYINNQVVSSVDYGDGNLQGSLSTIIPAGSTYKIEVYSGTIQGWWELR